MVMTRESVAQGVYAPKALVTVLFHTPSATGLQNQTNGSKAIVFLLMLYTILFSSLKKYKIPHPLIFYSSLSLQINLK